MAKQENTEGKQGREGDKERGNGETYIQRGVRENEEETGFALDF